ncbi:MAG: hypothetical protein F4Y63_11335, partial [Chloroflexi bacterium]|nr:hypothetical protein [Chloroflexota bacterium]
MLSPNDSPTQILLVEGPDDKHVISHICREAGYIQNFFIQDKGGIDKLLDSIGAEIMAPGRKVVGVVADANSQPMDRWQSLVGRFSKENISIPRQPDSQGTILIGPPRIGIWLMPDNSQFGELEHFVAEMIPDADPVWPRSQQYIDDIPKSEREFTEQKIMRAKVHSWLATRKEPGFLGQAI